jgi:hypothetical protein
MIMAWEGKDANMDNAMPIVAQLTFITVVYCFAYRLGYRTAQSRFETIIREINRPLKELFEKTQEEMGIFVRRDKKDRS